MCRVWCWTSPERKTKIFYEPNTWSRMTHSSLICDLQPTGGFHIYDQEIPAAVSPDWDIDHRYLQERSMFSKVAQWRKDRNLPSRERRHLWGYLWCQIQKAWQGCLENCTQRSCSSTQWWSCNDRCSHLAAVICASGQGASAEKRLRGEEPHLSCLMRTARTGLVKVNSSTSLSLESRDSRASSQIRT